MSDGWPGDTELSEEIPEHVDEEGPGEDDDDVKYCQQHQGPGLTGSVYLPQETYTCFEGRPSNNNLIKLSWETQTIGGRGGGRRTKNMRRGTGCPKKNDT